jgi:hypothetical protein
LRAQRVARLEDGGAVGSHELPVRATGQDVARELFAFEPAARDGNDAALAPGRHADAQRRGDFHHGAEEAFEGWCDRRQVDGHGLPP